MPPEKKGRQVPPQEQLFRVCRVGYSGDINKVETLVQEGANVNAVDVYECTPLAVAIKYSNKDIVKSLIDNGANVNNADKNGETPLHWASDVGDEKITALLIENGANVNAVDEDGETPLHRASYRGHLAVTILLIGKGANLLARTNDKENKLPVDVARDFEQTFLVPMLEAATQKQQQKVIPNKNDLDGTKIHGATQSGTTTPTVASSKKASKRKARTLTLDEQLFEVCEIGVSGDAKTVENLIRAGANVNAVDDYNYTPLLLASKYSNHKIAKLLVENGANVNVVDKNGDTPLHCTSTQGDEKITKLLIENGANVNAIDGDGWTPLHSAVLCKGTPATAKLLIENGADLLAKTSKDNKMPVDVAREFKHTKLVTMLEEATRAQKQKGTQIMNDDNKINIHDATTSGTTTATAASPEEPSKTTQGTKGDGGDGNGFVIWSDAAFDDNKEDEDLVPLHFAVKYSDPETLTEEIESISTHCKNSVGGNNNNNLFLHAKDSQGRTALDLAALTGQKSLMKTLEKAGVSYTKPKARMWATAEKRGKYIEAYKQYIMDSL